MRGSERRSCVSDCHRQCGMVPPVQATGVAYRAADMARDEELLVVVVVTVTGAVAVADMVAEVCMVGEM